MRYEIGVCIQTGDIVWCNGPYKPGKWNDIMIFRHKLKKRMTNYREKVEADMGYRGEFDTIRHPRDYISMVDKKAKRIARARHETINKRLKVFNALHDTWRHDISKHKYAIKAIVTLVQLSFERGEKPFQCKY